MEKVDSSTVFNIKDFGAVPDGVTLCTKAFVAAIDLCTASGGGTVFVPAGIFLSSPIQFKSNMTLHLDSGAKILFRQNYEDHPLVYTRWEGKECQAFMPLVYGEGLENVAITGLGVMDGQGEYWWSLFRERKLKYPRPRMISFENCNNVLIEDVKLINSPAWTINPICCKNVTINKVSITNPANSPNTDGINPDSCKNVWISNCYVDVGDDCITLKSGIEDCKVRVPCQNVTVINCIMVHGHGGVVFGSEMSGDVRNVVISNCIFEGTDRGIRFKSRRGRGGVVEDIRINNIIMNGVLCPFVINLYYHCGTKGKEKYVWDKNPYPVTAETPAFRRIHFSNITAREVRTAAGFIYGLPEMPVEDISFDNISVAMTENAVPELPDMMCNMEPMKKKGFYCCYAKKIAFRNVQISNQDGPAFLVEMSTNLEFTGCTTDDDHDQERMNLQ